MWMGLEKGRTLGVPLVWFLRLLGADAAAQEIVAFRLQWGALNKDVSVVELLEGKRGAAA
ncbi:DUF2442 domain-containing protein [Rhodobacteraceae bacterium N5(2021)]|uniref:DUF2442 domain-containing protein n=2 Tax=Gymnodinialimonas phycosphaerae TaxID=2841589 RepID=A0A975YI11_9RHOB|nr:DUF2442 domain-containing protein [Gymnodinialimonas phycosphaerae]MBY4893234.1 DUF2442 domain-containing protein [Gymnodinialimonas phycosphaerae]